jgi:hypothetical protein
MTQLNCRHAVLLNGCGHRIPSQLHVLQHDGMQTRILELADGSDANISLLMNVD